MRWKKLPLFAPKQQPHSLVILDEVGRGTSTFDGLAIAQAVVEYIHTVIKARCLFATHYHELTLLPEQFPGIASYHAACSKQGDRILFLYTIIKGVANGSFGMEVAQLAQMPARVIARARSIAHSLTAVERTFQGKFDQSPGQSSLAYEQLKAEYEQLINTAAQLERMLLQQKKIIEAISTIDFDNLSPKRAFDVLWQLKDQ